MAAYWITNIFRGTNQPIYSAWINEQIRESYLRATILSFQGQLNALGEILGGPLVGAIVWRSSAVFGLIVSNIILVPVVLFYMMAWKKAKEKIFVKM